jgi:hypothetical protein
VLHHLERETLARRQGIGVDRFPPLDNERPRHRAVWRRPVGAAGSPSCAEPRLLIGIVQGSPSWLPGLQKALNRPLGGAKQPHRLDAGRKCLRRRGEVLRKPGARRELSG